jgi:predicted P-loop ATPase
MTTKSKQNKSQLIQDYLDSFFRVIPLRGKRPLQENWQTSSGVINPEAIGKSNYGVALDADTLVIDVDPRNFPEDDDQFLKLQNDLGITFSELETLIVRTGSGGVHIYLNKPPTYETKEQLKEYKGIEFKTKGRQVVGPGSIHPDTGNTYKILKGSPHNIAVAPQNLLRLISRSGYNMSGENAFKGEAKEEDINRFIQFLNDAEPAVEGDSGDQHTFKIACRGRDFGLNEDQTHRCMLQHWNPRCVPSWDADELRKKVENAYMYNSDAVGKRAHDNVVHEFKDIIAESEQVYGSSEMPQLRWEMKPWDRNLNNNKLLKTFNNTMNFLLSPEQPFYNAFQYNTFTDNIEISRPLPWHRRKFSVKKCDDNDVKQIRAWLSREKLYNTTDQDMYDAILVIAQQKCYHPVREYLNSLEWDGVKRVDNWLLKYVGTKDSAYIRAVGRKVLAAAVARILHPGVAFHYTLVLEGPQGVGKSRLVKALGGEYSNDISLDPDDKDCIMLMEGRWVIELSEMATHRKSEADRLKAFLTRAEDLIRKPYNRTVSELPRQSIFIGTINPQAGFGYLKDPTGNRRFWPVTVGEINVDAITEDRDQLWAEAVQIYKEGEQLYLPPALELEAKGEQAERMIKDHIEDDVLRYVDNVVEDGQVFTASTVIEMGLGVQKHNVRDDLVRRTMSVLHKYYKYGAHYCKVTTKTVKGFRKDRGNDEI